METKPTGVRWTYAEFARLPESGGTRYEVIDDELVVTPSPSTRHQLVVAELLYHLFGFAKEHALGTVLPAPFDVLFGEGDYFEPDLVFVAADRRASLTDRGLEGSPALVVEVLSPSTRSRALGVKLERYRRLGVPEYWIVDPDARTVEVWNFADGAVAPASLAEGDVLRWRPVGGAEHVLELDVSDLFEALD